MPVFGSDSTVLKEGWLWKQGRQGERSEFRLQGDSLGGRVRNWKRRWFVITDGCLFYFETRTVTNSLVRTEILQFDLIGAGESARCYSSDRCWRPRSGR